MNESVDMMLMTGHAGLLVYPATEQELCFPLDEDRSFRHEWKKTDDFIGNGAKMRRVYECRFCGKRA